MSRSSSRELDPLVGQFEHLSDKRRANEALELLKRIASLVKPIMRQRGWRVGILGEFYPADISLLGMNTNHGEMIQLRLRQPYDENQFMQVEMIVDTMLHELSHIVHGPHNQHFHALWTRLREEHEALTRKGYTGEVFLGHGNRLGGRHVPMVEVRRRARAAAEERAIRTKNSGTRLGGQGIVRGQDVRDIIARAAEQRIAINRGCANDTDQGKAIARGTASKGGNVSRTQAEREDENEAAWIQAMIELVREDDAAAFGDDSTMTPETASASSTSSRSGNLDAKRLRQEQLEIERNLQRQSRPSTNPNPSNGPYNRPPPPPPSRTPPQPQHQPQTWTCDICTLINPIDHLICGACETQPPDRNIIISSSDSGSDNNTSTNSKSNLNDRNPNSSNRGGNNSSSKNISTNKPPRHPSLQPRLNAHDSLARIESEAARKRDAKPIGWECTNCHNWMEQMWWTCANCGTMKSSS
ncbi:hypothetical protein B0A52_03684 [Exophiala mesophila]|uniref:WLM domain-containing protein n=1 Tax=Exophiala mesophila TaxID=212818 RepID=A0A438NA53_EXOME|nr:hypothetical protein B0A52_03684 [Exophiala mesophila]